MTSASSATASGLASATFFEDEMVQEQWTRSNPDAGGDIFHRVVDCIKAYVRDVAIPERLHCTEEPSARLPPPPSAAEERWRQPLQPREREQQQQREVVVVLDEDETQEAAATPVFQNPVVSHEVVEILEDDAPHGTATAQEEEEDAARPSNSLPYMYLRSIGIVPPTSDASLEMAEDAALSSAFRDLDEICDPTRSARQNENASRVWEYCWRKFRRSDAGGEYGDVIPMFKPILLFSACMARNMVAVNSFYHNEHICQAVCDQLREASKNVRSQRKTSSSRGRRRPLAFS